MAQRPIFAELHSPVLTCTLPVAPAGLERMLNWARRLVTSCPLLANAGIEPADAPPVRRIGSEHSLSSDCKSGSELGIGVLRINATFSHGVQIQMKRQTMII